MSRIRTLPGRATAISGAVLLLAGAAACEEDGKTAPEKCLDPPPALYDIQKGPDVRSGQAGAADNPCVTKIGHGVNGSTGGTVSGGTGGTTGGSAAGGPTAGGPTAGSGGSAGKSSGGGGGTAAGESSGGAGGA